MTTHSGRVAQARPIRLQRPRRRSIGTGDVLTYVVLTIAAILVLMPLLWMFSTSLRPIADSYKLPPAWLPTQLRLENYAAPFESSVPFLQLFVNSLRITLAVTLGQLVTCSLAGYAFARLRFPGNNVLFLILLASLMVPNQVTIIPIYLSMVSWGFMNNPLAIILPGLISAFGVFLMRQFFHGVPNELLDAARMDGMSEIGIWIRIGLPLTKSAMAALAIFNFIGNWNAYLWPLIIASERSYYTLPVGLSFFRGESTTEWEKIMTAASLASIPLLSVFIIFQRNIIAGVALTGLKG